eukprot:CAMPEP_0115088882 /NCGR_PEP_ID=MMETSP0227-20121206/24290_1 /TAXON_ID=89957 /ORGANISM="Polarella glacialis, Strain CCMP 1383" /LENGTH=78 /DNA_ID=CAMNT_0002479305 /DNA_START=71 /DNA_END=307 /DNA_ORIENTATION=-
MNPRIFAALFSQQLGKATKEFLLNSPAFCRFAQESSKKGSSYLVEAQRAMQPVVNDIKQKGQEALREIERQSTTGKKK